MSAGLQVWDASGNLVFDTADQIVRFLGELTISANGSTTNSDLTSGTPFAIIFPSIENTFGASGIQPNQLPTVGFSGTTISYSFSSTPSGGKTVTVLYGVY